MGNRYYVAGRTAATAATIDNVGAELWNPHGTKSVYVNEVWWFQTTAAVGNQGLVRTSAKGTSTLTVTPDADNATDRRAVPPSGATLELTFSAQPTLATPYLARTNTAAAIGLGFIWVTLASEAVLLLASSDLNHYEPATVSNLNNWTKKYAVNFPATIDPTSCRSFPT